MVLSKHQKQASQIRLSPWIAVLFPLVLGALWAPGVEAQENDECLFCHSETDITGTRGDEEISVHVDPERFAASIHADLDCVSCHLDLEGEEMHDDEVDPVDCTFCHDDLVDELARARHGDPEATGAGSAPTCADCHGSHEIAALSDRQPECGSCHTDQQRELERSHHGRFPASGSRWSPGCSECHGGHDIRPIAERSPECASCHQVQVTQHRHSLHGKAEARGDALAPGCTDCHGSHHIQPASDPTSPTAVMNIPVLCGRCHREGSEVSLNREISQDHVLENYSMSMHGEGLYRQGLTVTAVCTSCHTSHDIRPHTDRRSSIHHDNVAETCGRCHGQIEQVHQQVIEGHLWQEEPHKIPACVDCHVPHKIRNVFYSTGSANRDCLNCHADEALTMERAGETVSLFVDEQAYTASTHADTACAQCHTEVTPSLERSCSTIVSPVDCGICHAEQTEQFAVSTHGTLHAEGDPDAPDCQECHVKHATRSKNSPASPTFARNVPTLCSRCHREGEKAAERIDSEIDDIVTSYHDSIHGIGLVESGLVVTATCADCHSAHMELPPEDERSTVHHDNIADTCGQCHHGIEETFMTSIHWPGNGEVTDPHELPDCSSCHSSHSIARSDREDFRFQIMDQCGRCHEEQAETFFDTFHGKVSRLGAAGAAKCHDCHGVHNILPTSDLNSTLSRDNVVATCAECHEGAHHRFVSYRTHATHHDPDKYPWLFWSFWAMTALLVGTLTFALLHTLAWLARLWLSRDEWKAHKAAMKQTQGQKLYRRFNRFQRTLHLVMLLSFFLLSLTGMALKFSYAGWAQTISKLLGGFESMGGLHRVGAVVLFLVFFSHIFEILWRKRRCGQTWGRLFTGPNTMMFTLKDIREIVQSIRWFFGLGERPKYGRYTYWEKFDYFAVFWGVLVIGSTGLILWFPELFTHIVPGWFVNVSTIIHSDEALLAVGFIFTIHFFNTHFRPDKFPMDPVIFTGRMTVDELKHDKPGEYEQLVRDGRLNSHLVDPFPRPAEKAIRIFGFTALAVGLTLIVLIVYAMLFGYR